MAQIPPFFTSLLNRYNPSAIWSALKFFCALAYDHHLSKSPRLRLLIQAAKKLAPLTSSRIREGFSSSNLNTLFSTVDVSSRDLVAIALGIKLLLRPSELVSIRNSHISFLPTSSHLPLTSCLIWIHRKKVQSNNGWVRYIIDSSKDSINIVQLLYTYLATLDSPWIFPSPLSSSHLTTAWLSATIRKHALAIGLPNRSGHSLRIGGASDAASQGIPPEIIKSMGNWLSDAYMKYIRPFLKFHILM